MKAQQLFSVAGKRAVVTGGANGLGFAFCRALADKGAYVTILDRDAGAAEAAAAELTARGGAVGYRTVDLTDADALAAAFADVAAERDGIDVVFANAGITAGPGFLDPDGTRNSAGAIENIPEETWLRVVDVNLTSVFLTIRSAVPHLKKAGGGRIIVTTSAAATAISPGVGTPYLATKAAAAHLVRQVAVELARYNILVNAIQPGPFQTRITTPELVRIFLRSVPLNRIAHTEEIEGLALFFASDASRFVTGAQYSIDGGRLLGRPDEAVPFSGR